MSTHPSPAPDNDMDNDMDVNAVVSYNLRDIRRWRGLTQTQVGAALARHTGHQLPQASISAMERSVEGGRRRRFDAHELYLLSVVFGVPIAYFFLPPPGTAGRLAGTGRPVHDLYAATLGRAHHLDALDDRIDACLTGRDDTGQGGAGGAGGAAGAGSAGIGGTPASWREDFLQWRGQRIAALTPDPDGLDTVARLLGALFDAFAAAGFGSFCRDHRKDHPDA
jgi:hypothetical protein